MTRAETIRVLRLEAQLARCQNALDAAQQQIAQLKRTAKVKAKKPKQGR